MSIVLAALLALTGILNNPPEDLLSLGNTELILKTLKIDQSEKALIDLIGGLQSQEKIDEAKLKAAVKLLREGDAKERRDAKKVLTEAGRDALPFFEKYVDDKDPEVSETAKNIIKNSDVAAKQSASSGLTPEVLKLLALRRLTELKSSKALPAVKLLIKDADSDISREAARAAAILEGKKPARAKRGEATAKALQLIPQNSGFAFALDMTEPEKIMTITDYLKEALKVKLPVPGMNAEMITAEFNKTLPGILMMIGNPQIDAVSLALSDKLGVDNASSWGGLIIKGSYNLKKVKKSLSMQMEVREIDGQKYFAQKWGPSLLPLDSSTLIISFGDNSSNHMSHFIKQLAVKKIPEKFSKLKTLSKSRLTGLGDLTKEQRELMKAELTTELQRVQGRQGPESEVQIAMINVGLLFTEMSDITVNLEKENLNLSASFSEEKKAKEMTEKMKEADTKLRSLIETAGGGMMAQFVDTKNPFTVCSSEEKVIKIQIKSSLISSLPLLMFMGRPVPVNPPQAGPERVIEKKPADQ